MAKSKGADSRRKRKNAFPEIKGKIVEGVELMPTGNGYAIGIMFQDRTYLNFDVEPYITISPDLSDWKTEDYKPLKRWPTLHSWTLNKKGKKDEYSTDDHSATGKARCQS